MEHGAVSKFLNRRKKSWRKAIKLHYWKTTKIEANSRLERLQHFNENVYEVDTEPTLTGTELAKQK